VNRKQFAIATLFAIVLLTLAFIPISSHQAGTYDPWLDYNEDGKIDVNELNQLGQAYGTTGDPTKNVTIVGHATKLIKAAERVSVPGQGSWFSGWLLVDGYSKVTVLIIFQTAQNSYGLWASSVPYIGAAFVVDQVSNFPTWYVKTYDVMNQRVYIEVRNNEITAKILDVDVYLMA